MKITIVIPVWKGKKLLKENLPLILKAKHNPKNKIEEIILVDDASGDGTVEFIQNEYGKSIRLIKHKKNQGFSRTVNRGVSYVKTSLFCLLNQDIKVSERFLSYTIKHFRKESVFAVCLHEKGFGPSFGYFENGFFQHGNLKELDKVQSSLWASGGSAVFRKKIWKKLKGLDANLYSPFYWEDVDIGYRAHKRGFEIFWEPKAIVEHQHESSINTNNFKKRKLNILKERNHLLFNWKNITSNSMTSLHIKALVKRTITHPGYAIVLMLALKKIWFVLKMRKVEVRQAKVSDEAIFDKFKTN